MSTNYKINKETVERAKEIIKFKKKFWEEAFPSIQFDENGRAKVGFLPQYDKSVFYSKIKDNTSPLFEDCLLEAYKELRLKPISLSNIDYYQYITKRIKVETETGFTQERALPGILARASSIWETKMPMYRPLRNVYKPIAKAKENQRDIDTLKEILDNMERGNTYIAYDNLMRVFQQRDMYISINPLDKLFSAGGYDTNSITKFSSCWRNQMEIDDNGDIEFSTHGEYSNPVAQVKLGEHVMCGMLIIPNEHTVEVEGMTFFGMLQRSHIWLSKDAIFIENIYPDKHNRDRRDTITNILNSTIKTILPKQTIRIEVPEEFNSEEWISEYNDACYKGNTPYLDNSSIDCDTGRVSIFY